MPYFTVMGPRPLASGGGGGGTIAFVAGVTTQSTDGSNVTSASIDSTGANLLIVVLADAGASTNLSDNKGNTWQPKTSYLDGSSVTSVRIFLSVPTSVGSGHTVTVSGTTLPAVAFAAFSGANASPFDTVVGTGGNSNSPAAGSITPGAANYLIVNGVSWFDTSGTSSVDSSFNVIGTHLSRTGNGLGIDAAYLIQSGGPTAVNPTWTETNPNLWAASNASFKN